MLRKEFQLELGLADTSTWGDLVANANDIIEYNTSTGSWFVSFDSRVSDSVEYVTNLTTNIQYRFIEDIWVKSYDGWYNEGDYSIVI
jgi:predicted RNA-binding protein with EMAP domain